MKALLSTYNRVGLNKFASALIKNGFELVSTGGTQKMLQEAEIPVTKVSDITGFPEILDGRVKTLHPKIHGGILARRDVPSHVSQLNKYGIGPIDLVVCNLYPFVETVNRCGTTLEDATENIDIGGPAMIRAAAKNFRSVIVVVDPSDYDWVAEKLTQTNLSSKPNEVFSQDDRKHLAQKAFQHVALYDTSISQYLNDRSYFPPDEIALGYTKVSTLRYGENPHQKGALYANPLTTGGIARAEQLYGDPLSLTNIMDADAAWSTVSDFTESTAVIVKHTNPCGIAVHPNQTTAYRLAFEGDSVSAYGGIVGFNRIVSGDTAKEMKGVLFHIIVAPDYENGALEFLKKRKQIRIIKVAADDGPLRSIDVKNVSGGILLQTSDVLDENPASWEVVTEHQPSDKQMCDLAFAWKVAKHIKSNTIVLAKDNAMVGMGAGQPNRVTSVHLALRIAGVKAKGSVLASDAFMPFTDNVELAAEGGVTSVVQPGGSLRDKDVIDAANRLGISMVFTKVRHFKH